MFNFFYEIKKNVKNFNRKQRYNLINISGAIVYFEGKKEITLLSTEIISFKIIDGRINIYGQDLKLIELTEDTFKISGDIKKIEEEK